MAKAKKAAATARTAVGRGAVRENLSRVPARSLVQGDADRERTGTKEVAKIVEEMLAPGCDETMAPERMKLASEIKEVLERRRLQKDGGKNYITDDDKEVGPVPFFLPLSAPHLVAPRLLAAVGEVPHDGDAPAGDQGEGGGGQGL